MTGRDRLVFMANQIACNFAVVGDGQAAEATAKHIELFWDARMKCELLTDREGLSPIALEALKMLRSRTSQVS